MNLETIKERQLQNNEYLSKVLLELENITNFIVGGTDINNKDECSKPILNGILESIENSQETTFQITEQIHNHLSRLYRGTFRDVSPNCN